MKNKSKEELLEEELKRQLEELSKVSAGSDGSKAIIEDFVALSKVANEQEKLRIEEAKIKADQELQVKKHEDELETEAKKMDRDLLKMNDEQKNKSLDRAESKKLRISQSILQGVGFGVTVSLAVLSNRSTRELLGTVLKFEEAGHYVSSSAGKGLVGSIFRRK